MGISLLYEKRGFVLKFHTALYLGCASSVFLSSLQMATLVYKLFAVMIYHLFIASLQCLLASILLYLISLCFIAKLKVQTKI